MPLRITNLASLTLPIDVTGVTPDANSERSLDDIRRMHVRQGNRQVELGELFRVEGDPRDRRWELGGDFSRVHGLGAGMTGGEIIVRGPVGRHAGANMQGGRIEIQGDAGDWLGAEMRGGQIRVRGNAGDYAGGAYAGSRRGMRGGTILISGDVGRRAGERMRRGLIAAAGAAGSDLGARMLAGTILVFGACSDHPGAGMRRGTIGLFGRQRPVLSPTFRRGHIGPLSVLHLLERHLQEAAFESPRLRMLAGAVELYHGDMLELGRGEILLAV